MRTVALICYQLTLLSAVSNYSAGLWCASAEPRAAAESAAVPAAQLAQTAGGRPAAQRAGHLPAAGRTRGSQRAARGAAIGGGPGDRPPSGPGEKRRRWPGHRSVCGE